MRNRPACDDLDAESGFRPQGLGFTIWGLGFRIESVSCGPRSQEGLLGH